MDPDKPRALVLEPNDMLRARTCERLARVGYDVVGVPNAASAIARLSDGNPEFEFIVHGVSTPRTWDEITAEHLALGELPCPVFLHGSRPGNELEELDWACRTAGCAPMTDDGDELIRCLFRAIPPAPSRPPPTGRRRASGVAKRPRKLLLVDDSEVTLELVQTALTEAGFDVRIAVAAAEALSIGATWEPDVAIVDLRRPDATELSLSSALKANGVRVTIIASSLPDIELARASKQALADGYVSKSRGVRAYVARVEEIALRALGVEETNEAKKAEGA
jgi:CheY-like chemotaxis protein